MSGEGKLERMEVDYSSTADEKIPECAQLAKVRSHVLHNASSTSIMTGQMCKSLTSPLSLTSVPFL